MAVMLIGPIGSTLDALLGTKHKLPAKFIWHFPPDLHDCYANLPDYNFQ